MSRFRKIPEKLPLLGKKGNLFTQVSPNHLYLKARKIIFKYSKFYDK